LKKCANTTAKSESTAKATSKTPASKPKAGGRYRFKRNGNVKGAQLKLAATNSKAVAKMRRRLSDFVA
jgi:hypothetical protein